MVHANATDEELLVDARRDGAAFEEFFRRHAVGLLAFFARQVEDPEAAADLMADTFAAALLAVPRFARRPEPPVSWLYGIARHKLVDYRRRRGTQTRALRRLRIERVALEDADIARIEHLASLADTGTELRAGLAALPADQRLAVEAHVVGERTYRELAAEAGTTEAAVRQRVSRGLRTLRKRLEKP